MTTAEFVISRIVEIFKKQNLKIFSKEVTGKYFSMIRQFEDIERHDKGESNASVTPVLMKYIIL